MNAERNRKKYRPALRVRVRRTLGFVLGVLFLALVDLAYHVLPKLTGRTKRRRRAR